MRELCYTGHNERLKNRDYFLLQQRKNLTKPYPLKKVQMSEVWPIQKDSEPRPRFACAGSASLTSVILFCHFALPLIFSSSRIGQTKRSRCRDLFVWPTRKDSNLRPSESESDALSSCATGRYSVDTLVLYHKPSEKASPFAKKVCVGMLLFPTKEAFAVQVPFTFVCKLPKSHFLLTKKRYKITIFRT